jgi:PIN domain nuclease of toxin-antitoxin system
MPCMRKRSARCSKRAFEHAGFARCGSSFSTASIWEIAIKHSLNRSDFDFRSDDIEQLAGATGFTELPILSAHCHAVGELPRHYCDPFDRLLVAKARFLPARLLTTDEQLARYSELVWVIAPR